IGNRFGDYLVHGLDVEQRLMRIDLVNRIANVLSDCFGLTERAHHERNASIRSRRRVLRKRIKDLWGSGTVKARLPDIPDHAGNRTAIRTLSDRIPVREITPRESLINQDDSLRVASVVIVKHPAFAKRNTEGAKISRADITQFHQSFSACCLRGMPWNREPASPAPVLERQILNESNSPHAGKWSDSFFYSLEIAAVRSGRPVIPQCDAQVQSQYLIGNQPNRCPLQAEKCF